jgi:hypothetical protein
VEERRRGRGPATGSGRKANELHADAEDKKKGEECLKLSREKKPYRETNP